jgi:hypothetical protein
MTDDEVAKIARIVMGIGDDYYHAPTLRDLDEAFPGHTAVIDGVYAEHHRALDEYYGLTCRVLIPISQGGAHAPYNLACACFLCNSLRGSEGGGEQLFMIG